MKEGFFELRCDSSALVCEFVFFSTPCFFFLVLFHRLLSPYFRFWAIGGGFFVFENPPPGFEPICFFAPYFPITLAPRGGIKSVVFSVPSSRSPFPVLSNSPWPLPRPPEDGAGVLFFYRFGVNTPPHGFTIPAALVAPI